MQDLLLADKPTLLMLHDEDAELFNNGIPAARVKGFNVGYDEFDVTPEAIKAIKPGRNVIAVHCHQTSGGQFIDVQLTNLTKRP